MSRFRFPNLETILWILASIAAFLSLLVFVPSFFNNSSGTSTAGADRQPTARPTLTPIAVPTATSSRTAIAQPSFNPSPRLTPFPTPAPNTQVYEFAADPRRSGWFSSGESSMHLGDRNLHAGSFKGQTFQSVFSFEMPSLAPGSKVRYAQVEVTGLNRNNVGANGAWTLQLLSSAAFDPNSDLRSVVAQANIGAALGAELLGEGIANQFIFGADQLPRLEEALNTSGRLYFRLNGPQSGDNLFTWDAGDRELAASPRPTLKLIAAPAPFAVITNTPTPENVLTAAANLLKITEVARRGTVTPLPRQFATATPLIVVTSVPTPANLETATIISAYATAVALTTGTFTPTPPNFITATPQPIFVPIESFSPTPTPNPTLSRVQQTQRPFPPGLTGRILFLSDSRGAPKIYIMDSNGKNIAQVLDSDLYEVAAIRDAFSPNGTIEAFNAPDPNNQDLLQIFLFDYSIPGSPRIPNYNQITFLRRGIAFAPSWSPDGKKVAYTSTETGKHEIVVMDLDNKRPTQITNTKNWNWNQFPSWSPDGKQIVYVTDQGRPNTFTEIWIMNADGTGAYKLLDWGREVWAPIWIKWAK